MVNQKTVLTLVILFFSMHMIEAHAQEHGLCVQPSPNIVAWWPFDELDGAEVGDVAGTNDGVRVGGPVSSAGKVQGALAFDGSNYVAVPDSDLWAFGTSDFTVEFWANFDVPAHGSTGHPGDVFISNDEGPFPINKWFLALASTHLEFHVNGPGTGGPFSPIAPFAPVPGTWYHLAVTRVGTDYRIYVDGVLRGSGVNVAVIPNADSILTIGRALEPFGGFMNGRIDEMSVYHEALSPGQLQDIVTADTAGKCKGVAIVPTLSTIQMGVQSSQTLEAISGSPPYAWSIVEGSGPPGMVLEEDGTFRGVATDIGEYSFTVEVTDALGDSARREFELDVVLVLPPPDIRVRKVGTVAVPGRIIDYFITVENIGDQIATDVPVLEVLEPSQVSLVSVNPPAVLGFDAIVDSSVIPWVIPSIQPGASALLSYQVRLDPTIPFGTLVSGPVCTGVELGDRVAACLVNLGATTIGCAACVPACTAVASCNPATFLACLPATTACTACLIGGPGPDGLPSGCLPSSFGVVSCFREIADDCASDDQDATGPIDPNEKLVDAGRFIQPDQLLVYPIHFENIGEVEAIDVFVTDVLDPLLDDSTLEILSPGGSYDPATRTLRWELLGRNLAPAETDNVLLSIKPLPNLPSGTEIRNSAEIQFEIFDTLVTPDVINVIDATDPSCIVDTLPAESTSLDILVSWTGNDVVGEVESHTVFQSIDGGDFTALVVDTPETSVSVSGAVGETHSFFCVAKDTVGNIEHQDLVAETSVAFVTDPDGDGDGVDDADDFCPDTVIPEAVPSEKPRKNRWALADADFTFDSVASGDMRNVRSYTIGDTGGCSCEQIIDAQGLGEGHVKHGCSNGAMDDWIELVAP